MIGGLAVQHWGEPRFTRDVDITLLTGFGREEEFVEPLARRFPGRIPDAADFALANRVLLLKNERGIGIDIALGGLPFEEETVALARSVEVEEGVLLRLCSPESLIVMKAFADRPQDWIDIRGVLIRQNADGLDWSWIQDRLTPLSEIKERPEIVSRLTDLWDEIQGA